jgi:hypothetical protein
VIPWKNSITIDNAVQEQGSANDIFSNDRITRSELSKSTIIPGFIGPITFNKKFLKIVFSCGGPHTLVWMIIPP